MALVLMRKMNHPAEKEYEADVGWQSDEDGGPLGGHATDEGEVEVEDDALTDEELAFLKQFPSRKKDAEERIRKLYAIADSIDKSHQKATKTNVVSKSASVVSGFMSLMGLALAPVTVGGSLMFTAAGAGLGVVAGVTNIVTDVKENFRKREALAEANQIMPTSEEDLEYVGGKKMAYVTATGGIVYKCGRAWETLGMNARALKLSKTHPHLTSAAKKLLTSGQVSAQSSRQVKKAFQGTALAIPKGALMKNGVLTSFFLAKDIRSLYADWKDLEAGSPTELAKELRERAEVLDRVLSDETRRYQSLKKKLKRLK
ncbi:apolipoprotein L6-like [Peromyscus leucopus]|uniref:apolipoprotein L6-like n=1 Tax=Peromyscus leucopus TaxID=10041 RepID=UPI00188544ED|nr:apolipoprotein L6-like [Peromyscus leucopus]